MKQRVYPYRPTDFVKSRSRRLVMKCIVKDKMPEWMKLRYSETRIKSGIFGNHDEYKIYSN